MSRTVTTSEAFVCEREFPRELSKHTRVLPVAYSSSSGFCSRIDLSLCMPFGEFILEQGMEHRCWIWISFLIDACAFLFRCHIDQKSSKNALLETSPPGRHCPSEQERPETADLESSRILVSGQRFTGTLLGPEANWLAGPCLSFWIPSRKWRNWHCDRRRRQFWKSEFCNMNNDYYE